MLSLMCCTPGPQTALPAGIGTISCPDISREEIVNACGIDDFHDGARTCVGWAAAAKDKWLLVGMAICMGRG